MVNIDLLHQLKLSRLQDFPDDGRYKRNAKGEVVEVSDRMHVPHGECTCERYR